MIGFYNLGIKKFKEIFRDIRLKRSNSDENFRIQGFVIWRFIIISKEKIELDGLMEVQIVVR